MGGKVKQVAAEGALHDVVTRKTRRAVEVNLAILVSLLD